jgi:hypothetical protein
LEGKNMLSIEHIDGTKRDLDVIAPL